METLVIPAQEDLVRPRCSGQAMFLKSPSPRSTENFLDNYCDVYTRHAIFDTFQLLNMVSGVCPAPPSPLSVDFNSSSIHSTQPVRSNFQSFPLLLQRTSSSASEMSLSSQFFTHHAYYPVISDSATSSVELVESGFTKSSLFGTSQEPEERNAKVVALSPHLSKNTVSTGLRSMKNGRTNPKYSSSERSNNKIHSSNSLHFKWTPKCSLENKDSGKTDKENHREHQQNRNKQNVESRTRMNLRQFPQEQGLPMGPSIASVSTITAGKLTRNTDAVTIKVSENRGKNKVTFDLCNLSKSMTRLQVNKTSKEDPCKLFGTLNRKKDTDSHKKMTTADLVYVDGSLSECCSKPDVGISQESGKNVCLDITQKKEMPCPVGTLNPFDFKGGISKLNHSNLGVQDKNQLHEDQLVFHNVVNVMGHEERRSGNAFSPERGFHSRIDGIDVEVPSSAAADGLQIVHSSTPIVVKIKHGVWGSSNQNCHRVLAHSPTEKWAGPAYSNSPPPSSLPLPKFPLQKLRTAVSMDIFSLQVDAAEKVDSSLWPCSLSAPSSPRQIPHFSEVTSGAGLSCNQWDTAFATKDLRRMLNLDSI